MKTTFKALIKLSSKHSYQWVDVRSINFARNEFSYLTKDGYKETLNLSEIDLLQSTGLKDKHGNMIYENDMVQVKTDLGEMYSTGVVTKVPGGFYIKCPHGFEDMPLTAVYLKDSLSIEIGGSRNNRSTFEHLIALRNFI